ncbi:MAG: dihydrolipoamide acetyltransferase family protein [Desulfuromonadaceae bacterium]|nr:dihydrolipoamide acetyltransferase family protein [Desulfuromonadaceae bacterium]
MSIEITMPKLSDTMTEGMFAGWKKNVGDRVERGDILAEVETDKAVMELEAFASGILIKTIVHGGEQVSVGTVLGLIGEAGEIADSVADTPSAAPAAETGPTAAETAPAAPATPVVPEAAVPHTEMEHEKASPLVRRLAREQDINLEQVKGSGPEGRITQDDLAGFARQQQQKPETAAPSASPAAVTPAVSTERAAAPPMRRSIVAMVTESWQTIPHFSVTIEIDMEACREIVRELKGGPDPVGYNALVITACARALLHFPLLCAADHDINDINISFAVSKADGLLMPVIRQCQSLSATEIERETSRLAEKSRIGRLTSAEMTGGSFSVSNLGMYGVDEFTALIMPGQSAILAIGAVSQRPAVRNAQLAVAAAMRVTLTSDHRTVDGAYAASFLAELRAILEKPASLLI